MVNVVVCVTGSVAGIKVAELLQQLAEGGAAVRVACSEHGAVFIEQPQLGRTPPVYYTDIDDYVQVSCALLVFRVCTAAAAAVVSKFHDEVGVSLAC